MQALFLLFFGCFDLFFNLIRRDDAAGDNKLQRFFDTHVEKSYVLDRYKDQKTGCRVRRCRNEHVYHILLQNIFDFAFGIGADQP